MNINKTERSIAKALILAQSCSDSGKNLDRGNARLNKKGHWFRYQKKIEAIMSAISLIKTNGTQRFHYWLVAMPDQNGNKSIVVYFDYYINCERQQMSFHTPWDIAPKEMKKMIGKGRNTEWLRGLSGHEAALNLAAFYGLSYE